jgi:hypothetical protein
VENSTISKRQNWEAMQAEDAVMGSETIPQVWDEMSAVGQEEATDSVDVSSDAELEAEEAIPAEWLKESADEGDWGIDGKGTGSYWMKSQWDGKVHDTEDWSRLYNVTLR